MLVVFPLGIIRADVDRMCCLVLLTSLVGLLVALSFIKALRQRRKLLEKERLNARQRCCWGCRRPSAPIWPLGTIR